MPPSTEMASAPRTIFSAQSSDNDARASSPTSEHVGPCTAPPIIESFAPPDIASDAAARFEVKTVSAQSSDNDARASSPTSEHVGPCTAPPIIESFAPPDIASDAAARFEVK